RHYGLSEDVVRRDGWAILDQSGDDVVLWLTSRKADATSPELTRKFPSGEVKRRVSPAERIDDYKARLTDARQTSEGKAWALGKDVEKADFRQKKADVALRRTLLMNELDKHTLAFVRALNVLVAEPVAGAVVGGEDLLVEINDDLVVAEALLKRAKDEAAYTPSRWVPWATDDATLKQVKADRVKTLQDVVKTLKTISDATKDLEVVTPAALGSEKV